MLSLTIWPVVGANPMKNTERQQERWMPSHKSKETLLTSKKDSLTNRGSEIKKCVVYCKEYYLRGCPCKGTVSL